MEKGREEHVVEVAWVGRGGWVTRRRIGRKQESSTGGNMFGICDVHESTSTGYPRWTVVRWLTYRV